MKINVSLPNHPLSISQDTAFSDRYLFVFLQKMLLGGCSNVSRQTLAYSDCTQKFAFIGEAHAYVFDTRGQTRLDAIIPFCEQIQSKDVGLIKETANLELSKKEKSQKATRSLVTTAFIAGKESEQLVSFITNRNYGLEFWGGVGVQCIDWNS